MLIIYLKLYNIFIKLFYKLKKMNSYKREAINDTKSYDYDKNKNVKNKNKQKIMLIIVLLSPLIIIVFLLFLNYKINYSINKCELKYRINDKNEEWSNYYNNCENALTLNNSRINGIIINLICPFEKDISKSLFYRYGNNEFVQNGEISSINERTIYSKYEFEISSKLKINMNYSIYNRNGWSNYTQKGNISLSYNEIMGIKICLA